MTDRKVIYLDDAIDVICKACSMEEDYHKCDGYPETSTWCDELVALRALPSAQPEPCELCSNLEKGDTLYQYSDWDGGIGFDYIRDIRFCPMCGRKLK